MHPTAVIIYCSRLTYLLYSSGTLITIVEAFMISSPQYADEHLTILIPGHKDFYLKSLFLFFLVSTFFLFIYYLTGEFKQRKIRFIKRIKQEEQYMIRKQTAEDLHDGLGNKLARITILSDILISQISNEDQKKINIINKIKVNAEELHSATKDILWMLDPDNDSFFELADHLENYGYEMFGETGTIFRSDKMFDQLESTILPRNISHNILMIFKEAINNTLKYAKAKNVSLVFEKPDKQVIVLKLKDDGKGFNLSKLHEGYGITNMKTRAERIKALLHISSGSSGTSIQLTINSFS